MSFYTSLTGLNGAQADIAAISNNIANVGTTGFKRSRAEFGDIFATSPLQAASSAIGSGTILKSIKQQFTQGNIESSLNALDLAISGQGFFALKPSLTSTQTVYTRNGAFSVNNDRYVVDSQGQLLQVFPVNADGSVIATGIQSAQNLQLPTTSGLPKASQTIQLGLNLPADAEIIPAKSQYTSSNPYVFDKTNPATYNKSTSITIYDSLGNPTIATIYYVKTSNATETSPTNKWQTHVFVGDREVTPQLITAKDDQSRSYYINKFGQITTDPQAVDPTFNAAAAHPLFKQDDQNDKTASTAASAVGAIIKTSGFDFGDTDATPVTIYTDPDSYALTKEGGRDEANPPYWGRDMFSISVDGSEPQSVSIKAGTYTGTQLAAEMTRAVNEKYSSQKYFSITDTYRKDSGAVVPGNDVIQLNLSKLSEDGATIPLNPPLEIDLLGTGGGAGTPQAGNAIQPDNKLTLTRDQLISLTQQKLNDALSKRRLELSKGTDWPDASNPPITVGYDVGARALTFTVDPTQLGADANEPAARFNSLQVFNPTSLTNDLGLPTRSASPDILVRANTVWTGSATLPSGDYVLDPREQRTGIKVSYNKDTRQFVFSSGSTGEASSIKVGRSEIAETATAQVSAFDMSAISFADATAASPINVSFEVNGRQQSFKYAPITPQPQVVSSNGAAAPTNGNLTTTNISETVEIKLTNGMAIGDILESADVKITASTTLTPAAAVAAFVTAGASSSAWTVIAKAGTTDTIVMTAKATGPLTDLTLSNTTYTGAAITTVTDGTTNSSYPTIALDAGQSITVGGRTLLANQSLTGADVAAAFAAGTTTSNATISGTLSSGWNASANGTNIILSTTSTTATAITTSTQGRVETATVQFQSIKSGQVVTVAGKTLTASADLTATNVASAFAGNTVAGATMGGAASFSGWTQGAASGSYLTFTSTTPTANVTDLTASASLSRGSKEDFFRQLDQQMPINFAPTKKTDATASQPEKQTIDVYGRIMKGDKFDLTLTLPGKTPLEQTLAVDLTSANLTEASTLNNRIGALGSAISAAISAAGSSANVTVNANDNQITLTYPTAGTTTALASLKQTRRGSDATGYDPIDLTDQSVLTAKTVRIDGTASTPTQYDITMHDPENNVPVFHVGDVFRIKVPSENGSEKSYDITVPPHASKTNGDTFNSITDFIDALKTSPDLPVELNLSYLTGATDTFTAKIGSSNNIAGTVSFEKIKDCAKVNGVATTQTVRPDPVGEFYFDHQGNNLEVVGNRNGEAFRMNVRIDGEVKTALPVGAANNPNGANGVQIGQAKTISLNKGSNDLLGVGLGANVNYVSGTGLPSSAATAIGTTAITSMSQTFFLNESLGENRMTFTVDGIVGTITLPIRAYTGDTFATAIQDRVNQIQDPKTGRIVSGVSVKFDPDNNRLIFTSGTTGQNSQINVVGHPNFGLGKVTQTAGSVPVITNLKQATDDQGNKLYVTADGEVTTADPGSQQNWYPLYLTEGQLTFDTVGKLISPKEGVIYSPFDPQNGSDLLRLNIDYGKYSTQFSSPFSVLSLSQDGYPSGSLNGLDIDAGGTIRANYTNGQTVALGKVMIANFANPNGLKQIGNANYVATSTSGQVVLGQAGADGFGNIKAGALERSNVDITEELVNLITAQRNFQANAKAIETTTQLSQTIIQIRG